MFGLNTFSLMDGEPGAAGGGTSAPGPATGTGAPAPAPASGTPAPAPAAGATPWYGTVKPETKGVVEMKGWNNFDAAVESYVNLEKLARAPADRLLQLPAQIATDADEATQKAHGAEMRKVYERLGMPAKPEDYGLKAGDNDGAFTKAAAGWFHELGLSTKQAQALQAKYDTYSNEQIALAKQAYEATITGESETLKSQWGAAYEKNRAIAGGAMKLLGLDEKSVNALEQALGWSATMTLLHNVGLKIGEDKFIGGDSALKQSMSPDEARARKAALMNDKAWVQRYSAGGVREAEELKRLIEFTLV